VQNSDGKLKRSLLKEGATGSPRPKRSSVMGGLETQPGYGQVKKEKPSPGKGGGKKAGLSKKREASDKRETVDQGRGRDSKGFLEEKGGKGIG